MVLSQAIVADVVPPPPKPCTARPITSPSIDGASAHAAEPATNRASAPMNSPLRPMRSPILPYNGMVTVAAST